MKREKIIYGGLELDSKEELEFFYWLEEAMDFGIVARCKYHPEPFQLLPKQTIEKQEVKKIKVKTIQKFLFHSHTYQPDFLIEVSDLWFKLFPNVLANYHLDPYEYYIDVKGAYQGSRLMSDQKFPINQKLVWYFHQRYINKVTLVDFFSKTFVPAKCAYAQNRKVLTRRKAYENCKLLSQLKERNVAV